MMQRGGVTSVLPLLLACCLLHQHLLPSQGGMMVEARGCQCNNGRVVEVDPCSCECFSDFQLPDCDYHIADIVRLDVYLDMPPSEFQTSQFLAAVNKGTLLTANESSVLYVIALEQFNKTNVLMKMPGYGVRRFIPMIERGEVWVQQQQIEAAYVIPVPAGQGNRANGLPAFDYSGYTITVDSLLWFFGALLLVFCMTCCESCCCFKNDEDYINEFGYAKPDEQAAEPYSGTFSPKQQQQSASPAKTYVQPTARADPAPAPPPPAAGPVAAVGDDVARRRSTMRKSVGDVDHPRPPRGRAKRAGKGRGLEPDVETRDLKFDQDSGLWWSAKEFLFFNKKTQMWYDPESSFWFDAAENKWFEFND